MDTIDGLEGPYDYEDDDEEIIICKKFIQPIYQLNL